jgi:DNA-binding NarL/FixJ family response regulator
MKSLRVLLVSDDAKLRESVPGVLRREGALEVETAPRVPEALLKMASTPFDVVVCTVESQDELACLIRVKKASPSVPVVVLSKPGDPRLATLGEYLGASLVLARPAGTEETAEALGRALRKRELSRETQAYVFRTRQLARDARRLPRELRDLVGTAVGLAAACEPRPFLTLLVANDPLPLIRTLARSGVPRTFRAFSSAEEAIAYLTGEGPFGDRSRHPLPSLIVSELRLPGKSGLDLVRWVRKDPAVRHVGVVLLTSSERGRDIEEAYAGGTNFFLLKSGDLGELADLVKTVYTQCMVFKTGLGY